MSSVIRVDSLSKKYVIGHQRQSQYGTFREALTQSIKDAGKRLLHPFRSSSNLPFTGLSSTEEFWALKDLFFEVKQGDRVGIIGRNGVGKSTLLKILSRITEPTTGRIAIRGRVASLLEVGTGFHPELTGRENIFLNGSILGMSKGEIKKKFDEIVSFSEVEKFLDTPVKRYSSGMYVRLAFAVAAHLEPEILIVDEVLAVGDVSFQKKCLGKMGEVAQQGRTVLFVSHNMQAVKSLCDRGLLLDGGKVIYDGSSDDAVDRYLSTTRQRQVEVGVNILPAQHDNYPPDLEVYRLELLNQKGALTDSLLMGEKFSVRIYYQIHDPDQRYRIGVVFSAGDQTRLATTVNTYDNGQHISGTRGNPYVITVSSNNVFLDGQYYLSIHVKNSLGKSIDVLEGMPLNILPVSTNKEVRRGAGVIWLDSTWSTPCLVEKG